MFATTRCRIRGSGSRHSKHAASVELPRSERAEAGISREDKRALFAFRLAAPEWAVEEGRRSCRGHVYSFLTMRPDELRRSIHHERMPVLLSEEAEFEVWLPRTPKKAFASPVVSTQRKCGSPKRQGDKEYLGSNSATIEEPRFL